jgi:hypothetical protein
VLRSPFEAQTRVAMTGRQCSSGVLVSDTEPEVRKRDGGKKIKRSFVENMVNGRWKMFGTLFFLSQLGCANSPDSIVTYVILEKKSPNGCQS